MCGEGGACVAKGGVSAEGGLRGVHGRGHAWWVHAWHAHPLHRIPRDMVGQCAGGTHPTGMHSCYYLQTQNLTRVSMKRLYGKKSTFYHSTRNFKKLLRT